MKNTFLAAIGGIIGGALGYFLFMWLGSYGYYAPMFPGVLLGMGAGAFSNKSIAFPIACGVAGLALGLFAEWRFEPFINDNSLQYFVAHLSDLTPPTIVMIGFGAVFAFTGPYYRTERKAPALGDETDGQTPPTPPTP